MLIRRYAQQSISYALRRGFFNKNNTSKPAASGALGTETIKPAPETVVPPAFIAHELDNNAETAESNRTFPSAQQNPASQSKSESNPISPLLDHQNATTAPANNLIHMQLARFPHLSVQGPPYKILATTALLHAGTGQALADRPKFLKIPFPYPLPSSSEWPFAITDFPGMGKGMRATEDIPAGELVLDEKLLLITVAEVKHESEEGAYQVLDMVIDQLDDEERKGFFGLFNCKGTSRPQAKGILDTNMIAIGPLPGPFRGMHGGLGLTVSRINHSCCPNAYCGFDIDTLSMAIIAFRPIQKDEQIFISYIPTVLSRKERQSELDRLFFTCTCPSCQPLSEKEGEESDARRELIFTAITRPFDRRQRGEEEREATDPTMSRRIVEALDTEGLTVSHPELAGVALDHISRLAVDCCEVGDREGAMRWGRRFLEVVEVGVVEGVSEDEVKSWEKLVEAPERAPVWGLRGNGL